MRTTLIALCLCAVGCVPKVGQLSEEIAKDDQQLLDLLIDHYKSESQKRIPDQPINANEMAILFLQNKVQLNIQANPQLLNKNMASTTVLLQVNEPGAGDYVHAITHVNGTPYRLLKNPVGFRASQGELSSKNNAQPRRLHHVRFLKDDPRLIIFPVGPAGAPQVKALGVQPFKLAKNPFKFPKAFIMNKAGRKSGVMEVKLDHKNPGYMKVDRIFFNFGGKFNPAPGDLVFSQTGDLIDIMANNKYCRVITNTTPVNAILFGPVDPNKVGKILKLMRQKIDAKPFPLR
jgi:hypothetical protein